jgi:hypothetical protein
MIPWRAWLPIGLSFLAATAHAGTDVGTFALVDGSARVLRGATWYKLAPGARIEPGDIVAAMEGAQVQLEFTAGIVANLSGGGTLHVGAADAQPIRLGLPAGWLKLVAKPPGAQLRVPTLDIATKDAILVVQAAAASVSLFVESGAARVAGTPGAGADAPARDAKRGEFWTRSAALPVSVQSSPSRAFVAAMPRHFADSLPVLGAGQKARPDLLLDHEITYAEALPWLAGPDRAAFERRFAVRLRDPAFRKAAEADIARYPAWDRQLHPDKYAPKTPPAG